MLGSNVLQVSMRCVRTLYWQSSERSASLKNIRISTCKTGLDGELCDHDGNDDNYERRPQQEGSSKSSIATCLCNAISQVKFRPTKVTKMLGFDLSWGFTSNKVLGKSGTALKEAQHRLTRYLAPAFRIKQQRQLARNPAIRITKAPACDADAVGYRQTGFDDRDIVFWRTVSNVELSDSDLGYRAAQRT
nr:hypothetical protein CFP56_55951 [Quercus suber]